MSSDADLESLRAKLAEAEKRATEAERERDEKLLKSEAQCAAMRGMIETIHAGMGERNWIYEACERALSRTAGRAFAKRLRTAEDSASQLRAEMQPLIVEVNDLRQEVQYLRKEVSAERETHAATRAMFERDLSLARTVNRESIRQRDEARAALEQAVSSNAIMAQQLTNVRAALAKAEEDYAYLQRYHQEWAELTKEGVRAADMQRVQIALARAEEENVRLRELHASKQQKLATRTGREIHDLEAALGRVVAALQVVNQPHGTPHQRTEWLREVRIILTDPTCTAASDAWREMDAVVNEVLRLRDAGFHILGDLYPLAAKVAARRGQ